MLTLKDINSHLLDAEYAVRGPIVNRAQELEKSGKKIIYCNIGNPQALNQKPLTYIRQVLSMIEYPQVFDSPYDTEIYHIDLIERTKLILKNMPFGTGAYTQSQGVPFFRQAIAEFIEERDGIPANADNIVLTDGASKGVQSVIMALIKKPSDGFMIPIPQYPLYSATLTLYGGSRIGYYLDENNNWQLNEEILKRSYKEAKTKGIEPVAICIINPGNPTGAILSYDNIKMIISFAKEHNLAILADEVYQENIYDDDLKFYSFAKVMNDMNETTVPLFSFHSASKGYMGECGHRGGYMEMRNLSKEVLAEFTKLQSISLCSNTAGQIVTYLMVSPPRKGDDSYKEYIHERDTILSELKYKAELLGKGLNNISGMEVIIPKGAMYAFVKLNLPINEDVLKMTPDERSKYESKLDCDYCMSLLEETGICVVPGSGFGQLPGTLHFRTTFLPPVEEMESLVSKIKDFHKAYVNKLMHADGVLD